jgi:hypothetical protein
MEGNNLRIPNRWSWIGRLFMLPFLGYGLWFLGGVVYAIFVLVSRGMYDHLLRGSLGLLGLTALGLLLAVPGWIIVFSWSDVLFNTANKRLQICEGSWPWLKRSSEPFSAFRAVLVKEEVHSNGGGDSPSVTSQSVFLTRADKKGKPRVVDRCDSYDEAMELAQAVSKITYKRIDRQ